mgnify:CR=1 FL=1
MKNFNLRKLKKQGGFSLVELMVVIVLIGALLYFIIPNLPIVRDFIIKKNLVDNTNALYSVASEYAPNGDWTNVTTANLLASEVLKEYHNAGDTAILNPQGNAVDFAPASVGAGVNNALLLTQIDMTNRPCNLFVNGYWDSAELISVNAIPVKTSATQDVDIAAINANCTNNANSVAITKR